MGPGSPPVPPSLPFPHSALKYIDLHPGPPQPSAYLTGCFTPGSLRGVAWVSSLTPAPPSDPCSHWPCSHPLAAQLLSCAHRAGSWATLSSPCAVQARRCSAFVPSWALSPVCWVREGTTDPLASLLSHRPPPEDLVLLWPLFSLLCVSSPWSPYRPFSYLPPSRCWRKPQSGGECVHCQFKAPHLTGTLGGLHFCLVSCSNLF